MTENNHQQDASGVLSLQSVAAKTDTAGRITAVGLMAAGLLCALASPLFVHQGSSLSTALIAVGVCIILYGIYRWFNGASRYVYLPTGVELKYREYYFQRGEEARLRRFVGEVFADGANPSAESLPETDPNGGLRLEVLTASDGSFAAAQLQAYADLLYHPVTGVSTAQGAQAAALCRLFATLK